MIRSPYDGYSVTSLMSPRLYDFDTIQRSYGPPIDGVFFWLHDLILVRWC